MEIFETPVLFEVKGFKTNRAHYAPKRDRFTLYVDGHSEAEVFVRLLDGYSDYADLNMPLSIKPTKESIYSIVSQRE